MAERRNAVACCWRQVRWPPSFLAGAEPQRRHPASSIPQRLTTNTGAINCVTFNDNANHTGDVVNDTTGTITVLGLPGQFGQQTGISVFGAGTQITGNIINNGTISAPANGQIMQGIGVDAANFPGSLVTGSITNNGSIDVSGLGMYVGGNVNGSIVNNNIIHSGFTAINVTGTNTGSPVTIGGSVINAGTITFTLAPTLQFPSASNQAVGIGVSEAHVGGSVINSGSITTPGQTGVEVRIFHCRRQGQQQRHHHRDRHECLPVQLSQRHRRLQLERRLDRKHQHRHDHGRPVRHPHAVAAGDQQHDRRQHHQ